MDQGDDAHAADVYLQEAQAVLQRIRATQGTSIEAASKLCARSIANDGLVFAWGGGHSRMCVEELFPRIGSFPGFYPMVELALTNYTEVVGANGLEQTFFLERQEGYADVILSNYEFGPHDSMLCFSNTGINGVVIDMALGARERGMPVIAVTSVTHGDATASRHTTGLKLKDIADVTIDNCSLAGDAAVTLEGLEYPVGPTSTIAAVAVVNALKTRTAELLLEQGHRPVVLPSPHFVESEAQARDQVRRVYQEFKRRKRMLYGRE